MKVTINPGTAEEETIMIAGGSANDALRIHGYNPDTTDYEVEFNRRERLDRLEEEIGV